MSTIPFGWCYREPGERRPLQPPSHCRWCNTKMALIRPNKSAAYVCPLCDISGKRSRGVPDTRK